MMDYYRKTTIRELEVNGSATHQVVLPGDNVEYADLKPRGDNAPAKVFGRIFREKWPINWVTYNFYC